jgi:hypothetical protein
VNQKLLLIAAFLGSGVVPEPAVARPVPTTRPGGPGAPPDSIVLEFPVRRAPSLLSLRAVAPLSALPGAGEASASLLRREEWSAATVPRGARGESDADALVVSGTKSLSVEVGRGRDASLSQALDLTVRGRVAGDVEVAAILTDQRLPFEPDGSTRELEDLDRVSLSVRAPHGEATLGDFRLDGLPGEFARVTRSLEGVRGGARVRGTRWDVAAASAKGERRSLEFRGEEGKQGPYALTSRGVESDGIGIVAGTETVWLDGLKLRRGADADYVVDYGQGTLTFTVRRPVTAESRIAVDLEAAASRYRRTLYAASTRAALKRGGEWYASYLREGDDAARPFGPSLTAEDRRALGALGDSVEAPLPSGVRHVGPGQGSYTWDGSDPARAHWIYLGPARGDYEVEFAAVGAGRGAYADTMATDGTRFYRYMGPTLGSYVPGRALAVPDERHLVDVGGAARVLGALALEGEMARSAYDRNALSSLDDADNAGTAARLTARLDPRSVRLFGARLGTVRASASFRSRDERFQPLDRLEAGFEGERWNQRSTSEGERRHELALQYDPVAAVGVRADAGLRRLSGGSRAMRRAAALELRAWMPGALRWEEARNTTAARSGRGLRSRWSLDLARERGTFLPKVSAAEERIRGHEGDSADARRSRLLTLGLGLTPSGAVRIRSSYGWRRDHVETAGARNVTRARVWEGGVAARAGEALALDAAFTRRRVDLPAGAQASDLAQLALAGGRPGAPITSELRYDVTQLREPRLIRSLVAVGDGAGSYDPYGNPKLGGGYEMVSASGNPTTRSRASVQLRVDAYPGRAPAPAGRPRSAWRALGASAFVRLETLSSLPLGRFERALRLGDYLAEGTTLRGTVTARQSLEYAPLGSRFDARVEVGARRDVSGEVEGLRSRGDGSDARLRIRCALPLRLRATATADVARAVQATRAASTDGRSDVYRSVTRGRGYEVDLSRALGTAWTVSLLSRHRRDADLTGGGFQDNWSAGPTARCAGSRLRLDGRALYGRTEERGAYAPAGRYLVVPPGARLDYDLLGEYRVGERLSVSMTWSGAKIESRRNTYSGRFELRSYF